MDYILLTSIMSSLIVPFRHQMSVSHFICYSVIFDTFHVCNLIKHYQCHPGETVWNALPPYDSWCWEIITWSMLWERSKCLHRLCSVLGNKNADARDKAKWWTWPGNKLTETSAALITGISSSSSDASTRPSYADIWKWLLPISRWPWAWLDVSIHSREMYTFTRPTVKAAEGKGGYTEE